MRSKNQEVDPLFAPFITKVFSAQRIFRVLRNSLFRTNDLKATFGQRQSCRPIFNFYAILIPVSNQKIEIPPIVNQSFMVYIHRHTCPSMLGFVKSFCGISDFFLKILPFQSKFSLPHALMSCKAIYF